MKAARIHRFGPPEVVVVEDMPMPSPGPNEVLVSVMAAGVAPWDALIREGKSKVSPQPPLTLGSDFSGVVERIGPGVTDFAPDDEVYGVTNPQFCGAQAEFAVARSGMIARKPQSLNHVEAASAPVIAVTAWQMLFQYAQAMRGQTVMVIGASCCRSGTLRSTRPVSCEAGRKPGRTDAPLKSKLMYNPPMPGIPWSKIALGLLLVIAAYSMGGQKVESPQPEKSKPPVKTEQRGRILGIGGVFFKSANRDQMREWYSQHLGLADKGSGVMLPWREHDDPQKEHVTVWTIFPASTNYFPATQPLMVNYIVDDMDALLERLKQEGVKIDPKRMDESYGRFAWIYDSDGNKIELWQPLPDKP